MSTGIPFLIEQALQDDMTHIVCKELAPAEGGRKALWLVKGQVRSDTSDPAELVEFLEELAEDAAGVRVFVDAPVLSPAISDLTWLAIAKAAEQREDVVQVRQDEAGLLIRARHQPSTLGQKRNRLPKLRKRLAPVRLRAEPLGSCQDVELLSSLPATQAFMAGALEALGLAPEALHTSRIIPRYQRLEIWLDSQLEPVALLRLQRELRDRSDVELVARQRISAVRARDELNAALGQLDWLEGHRLRWDDKLRGLAVTVETELGRRESLDRFFRGWERRLGVPVAYQFDTGRSLMTGRIAGAFPPEGILTRIHHADEQLYVVEGLLPLKDPQELEDWSDEMEEAWGIQIVFEQPFLRAPDLRHLDRLGSDLETIALRYNRPRAYPAAALDEAQAQAAAFDLQQELPRRRDIRRSAVLSIDPKRTRDLDDALSIEEIRPGVFEVGVHIADVCPFVAQDGPLDAEALSRGFTTYLKEGEIPVLPEILANQICSLHGGQDSLALSLFARLDAQARLMDFELARTVIHNHCRLNYSQAQAVIDGAEHRFQRQLRELQRLSVLLRAQRKAAGSLDLNLEPEPQAPAHQLIEEFMLLANECVARFLIREHPLQLCLYRTHPQVSETDWGALQQVAQFLGCDVRVRDQASMQAAMEELAGGPGFEVFRFHVGQVLEKATYHFEQLGHGALAKMHYAHFTSPIRRYSDLIVHRLIEDALYREERGGSSSYTRDQLVPIQDHLNAMEIRVDAASFESHRLEELRRYDGRTRNEPGILVGLMRGRLWIRLEDTDLRVTVPYQDRGSYGQEMPVRVTDQRSGMSYALGQAVQVRTRGVDWARKSIDAEVVG